MADKVCYFSGDDRVEFSEAFGRPLRMANLEALKVSDAERVRELLRKRDNAAQEYIELLHALNTAVVSTFLEWCLALPAELVKHAPQQEREVTAQAVALWSEGAVGVSEEATKVLRKIFTSEGIAPTSVEELRAGGSENIAMQQMWAAPLKQHTEIANALATQDFAAVLTPWENYLTSVRSRHDLCGQFVSAYVSVTAELVSQGVAEEILQDSLESCALLAEMWKLVARLDPAALAAMLAEHLRSHFSGIGRQGAVEIIEEADRFRLVFEPCGTGGAMRRLNVPGLKVLPDASPSTWGLAGVVPSYCAHCARNEITSIKLLGYPAWVTEFDPDPLKPCGWTVYKDPKSIPSRFFSRVGEQVTE